MSQSKAELQQALKQRYEEVLRLLPTINPLMVVYEESGWRVKDIIAHVVTWETERLRSLHAYRRGSAYQIKGYERDEYNGLAANAKQFETLDQILMDWDAVRNWFDIYLNAMPESAMNDDMIFPWGQTGTVRELITSMLTHLETHLADIRSKITTQTSSSST